MEKTIGLEETERFTEYGISYRDDEPRRGTWTPNYDDAMRDAAWRNSVHGEDMGPITVVERTTVISCTPWKPAVRPEVDVTDLKNAQK